MKKTGADPSARIVSKGLNGHRWLGKQVDQSPTSEEMRHAHFPLPHPPKANGSDRRHWWVPARRDQWHRAPGREALAVVQFATGGQATSGTRTALTPAGSGVLPGGVEGAV